MADPYFSLVVLCYRSGHSIVPYIERVRHVLSRCAFSWELVLVGNYLEGSGDETPEVLAQLAQRWTNVRCLARPKQGMMGWDMRLGLDAAQGEYLGVVDGDGQFPPESIVACLLKADLENLDLAKTYRVRRDDGVYRRFVSAVYNFLVRLLFPVKLRDINSKPKVIRRDAYERLQIESNDWFVDAEIVLKAVELNLKTGEMPIHFVANNSRASFVRPSAVLQFLSNLLRYRFQGRRIAKQAFARDKYEEERSLK